MLGILGIHRKEGENLLDYILSYLCDGIAAALDLAVKLFLGTFGFDIKSFNTVFPYAANAFPTIRYIGIALMMCFATYSLFVSLAGNVERMKESPSRIIVHIGMALFGIYLGNYLLMAIVNACKGPYEVLMGTSYSVGSPNNDGFQRLSGILSDMFYQVSIIFYLILLIMIGISFLKVLMEAVQRYVVLFCMIYLSPLAFSTLASAHTRGIFGRYVSMFVGQCILLLLNVWCLKMVVSAFSAVGAADSPTLAFILTLAFTHVAQRMDTYLNQLGISAAITGGNMLDEVIGVASVMSGVGRFAGKAIGGGAESGGPGGILGFGQKMANTYGKFSPTAAAADFAKGRVGAVKKTVSGAYRAGTAAATSGGSFAESAQAYYKDNIQKNIADSDDAVRDRNVFAKEFGPDTVPGGDTDKAMTNAIIANGEISEEGLRHIENRPSITSGVMKQMENYSYGKITEPKRNTAMLSSMKAPGSENFIRAGAGTLNGASNFTSEVSKDGMYFSYQTGSDKNPKMHTMSVKNESQFNALPVEQQHGYTSFTTPDGQKNFVQYDGPNTHTVPTPKAPDVQPRIGQGHDRIEQGKTIFAEPSSQPPVNETYRQGGIVHAKGNVSESFHNPDPASPNPGTEGNEGEKSKE